MTCRAFFWDLEAFFLVGVVGVFPVWSCVRPDPAPLDPAWEDFE